MANLLFKLKKSFSVKKTLVLYMQSTFRLNKIFKIKQHQYKKGLNATVAGLPQLQIKDKLKTICLKSTEY